ncbi:GntP family permease [Lactobacillus xylocopicola]|uniref:Gluconate permease n=1 Tax=Lactobacillus xylocopicola TaxID=2976676 RepID=A0ABM8BI28_9LACO|nr:SLC13 family permease [Lactobacillus xylocopicola]BDR60953.1 gluconate permease [Lactobacillus xylocopicola]
MSSTTQMVVALVISIIVLVLLLVKSNLNAFTALIIGGLLTGILGGLSPIKTVDALKTGFGNTMASLGILIAFGVMIGKVLEVSGATAAMGKKFVAVLGKGHEVLAMILTGFVTSLAIFCVPAFLMLFPLAKDISKRTGTSISALGIGLAGGLLWSHELVPPASGPLGGAALFNANISGNMILGFLVGIPMIIFVNFYAKWIGKKYHRVAEDADESALENTADAKEPSFTLSIMPILIPIVLILLAGALKTTPMNGTLSSTIQFVGSPVVALGLGLLIGVLTLLHGVDRKKVAAALDDGIVNGGKTLVLIAAGGALGNVVNESGAGNIIAKGIAHTGLPAILVPFIIASLLRIIQGSGTVAIFTTASITAPMVATLGINPILANIAACVGAMVFSYFNDSYFWAINDSIGATSTKEQMMNWSVPTTVCWLIGGIELLILNVFI